MIPDIETKHKDKLLLALVSIILAGSTVVYILKDKTPPPWDPADHISAGYDYYQPLVHRDFKRFYEAFFVETRYYAPLVHLAIAGSFLLFGVSRFTATIPNFVSLAVLLGAVYWITRTLHGDQKHARKVFVPGLLAALITVCCHFPGWLLHDAFLDYPLIAIVTVSFALLIRADDFKVRGHAVAFGVAAGLGMLTKQTFPFFFFLPCLYVIFKVLFKRDFKAIINLVLAGLIIACMTAIWYGPHLKDVIEIFHVNKIAAFNENEAPILSFISNFYYIYSLIGMQMQVPLGLMFLAGLIYTLVWRRTRYVMLYLWLASGIFCFALVANKDGRYTIPILPAAAILAVSWTGNRRPEDDSDIRENNSALKTKHHLRSLFDNGVRPAILGFCVIWSFVSFFNSQWCLAGNGYRIDTPHFPWMVFAQNYYGFDHRPLMDDWSVPAIVQKIAELGPIPDFEASNGNSTGASRRPLGPPNPLESVSPRTQIYNGGAGNEPPKVGVVVNLQYLNPSSIALYSRLLARGRAGSPIITVEWLVDESSSYRIDGCDYILVRTGLDLAEWVSPMEKKMAGLIESQPSGFVRVTSFPIPLREAEAVLYKVNH